MSSQTPQQTAASDLARSQAYLSQQLAGVSLPEYSKIIGDLQTQLNGGQESPAVSAAFGAARSDLATNYAQAWNTNKEVLAQRAKQSGGMFASDQMADTNKANAFSLSKDFDQANRNLSFQETQANLGQYNTLLGMLGQASGAAMNAGSGYTGNQARAISGLSNSNPWGGALSGAASGAVAGTAINAGWGTAIGAVVGGVGGYLGSGG